MAASPVKVVVATEDEETVDGSNSSSSGSKTEDNTAWRWKAYSLVVTGLFLILLVVFLLHLFWRKTVPETSVAKTNKVDESETRRALAAFVDSVEVPMRDVFYHPDAAAQKANWRICTIVQQCGLGTSMGEPEFMISLGNLSVPQRALFLQALATALHSSAYDHLMMQDIGNILLQEYQTWATTCPGRCVKTSGTPFMVQELKHVTVVPGVTFQQCGDMYNGDTTWLCDGLPLILFGNMNTTTAEYFVNNIFIENQIHARNNYYDFVSVYGDLNGTGQFGFRYSGHHYDINLIYHEDGSVDDMPAFFGHNPIIVLPKSPDLAVKGNPNLDRFHLWSDYTGVNMFQFPGILQILFTVSQVLPAESFVPLSLFDSTPQTGGLTLSNGKSFKDFGVAVSSLDKECTDALIELVQYTHLARRGPSEKKTRKFRRQYGQDILHSGRLIWTSTSKDNMPTSVADLDNGPFFYVQLETDDLFFFAMLNQMFTLVSRERPSNHLHSILTEKSMLAYLSAPAIVQEFEAHDHFHPHGHWHR